MSFLVTGNWFPILIMYPSYLSKCGDGPLKRVFEKLLSRLSSCDICPRNCRADRLKGEAGFCGSGRFAKVYAYQRHMGEEPAISGIKGSGTVFFSRCNLRCVYCQNYRFSQEGEGTEALPEKLAEIFLRVQKMGCHNLNLVTPTHVIVQVLEALVIAVEKGFSLPIVYNSSGYDSLDVVRALDGIVDIYMPDMRYGDNAAAKELSAAPDYVEANHAVVKEMFRQVGGLQTVKGIAKRGLIIRHLVLPDGLSETEKVFDFIAGELSKEVHISLMSQYNPLYKAAVYSKINRRITEDEYVRAKDSLRRHGLENGWVQESPGEEERDKFCGENFKRSDL